MWCSDQLERGRSWCYQGFGDRHEDLIALGRQRSHAPRRSHPSGLDLDTTPQNDGSPGDHNSSKVAPLLPLLLVVQRVPANETRLLRLRPARLETSVCPAGTGSTRSPQVRPYDARHAVVPSRRSTVRDRSATKPFMRRCSACRTFGLLVPSIRSRLAYAPPGGKPAAFSSSPSNAARGLLVGRVCQRRASPCNDRQPNGRRLPSRTPECSTPYIRWSWRELGIIESHCVTPAIWGK